MYRHVLRPFFALNLPISSAGVFRNRTKLIGFWSSSVNKEDTQASMSSFDKEWECWGIELIGFWWSSVNKEDTQASMSSSVNKEDTQASLSSSDKEWECWGIELILFYKEYYIWDCTHNIFNFNKYFVLIIFFYLFC